MRDDEPASVALFGHELGQSASVWRPIYTARAEALEQRAATLPAGDARLAGLAADAAEARRRAAGAGAHSLEARDAAARATNIERSHDA